MSKQKSLVTLEGTKTAAFVFNLLFSKATWVTLAVVLFAGSVALNVLLFRTNYVLTCWDSIGGIRQGQLGHLMNRARCDEAVQNRHDSIELARRVDQEQEMNSSSNN